MPFYTSFPQPVARRRFVFRLAALGMLTLSALLPELPAQAISEVINQIEPVKPPATTPGTQALLTRDGELQPVLNALSTQEAIRLLKEAGFDKLEVDPDGDIIIAMQGIKVLLIVGSHKGEWLLMQSAYRTSRIDYAILNDWNRRVKYSRAYLDDEGVLFLESDQDLSGGVTPRRLLDFFKSFDESLRRFEQDVLSRERPRD